MRLAILIKSHIILLEHSGLGEIISQYWLSMSIVQAIISNLYAKSNNEEKGLISLR